MHTLCPKCGKRLEQSGEITLTADGPEQIFPVFQCDDCPMTFEVEGQPFQGVYTFVLDEEGRPFDPPLL